MGKWHYLSRTKEYRLWVNLRAHHKNELDDNWKENPSTFIEYVRRLANCGAKGYTLVRANETLQYSPGNVLFIKRSVRNARRNYKGYVGIRKRGKRYMARITVNRSEIAIGTGETQEEVLQMRNDYIISHKLPHRIQ